MVTSVISSPRLQGWILLPAGILLLRESASTGFPFFLMTLITRPA